ncbi:MAG: hypothetical protein ABFR62_11855 [Bacteroidota bacterium]
MEEKKSFRVHSFILFLVAAIAGVYLAYIQLNGSQDIYAKLISLFIFLTAMYLATKNWVKDNPDKNKKNWSDSDQV